MHSAKIQISLLICAFSNVLKILQPKNENFQIKNSVIFHISAQNIDEAVLTNSIPIEQDFSQKNSYIYYYLSFFRQKGVWGDGGWGGAGGKIPWPCYDLSRNKKNNVYPCKPQFYYVKVGFKGSKLYRYVFLMLRLEHLSESTFSHIVDHIL